MKTVIIGAGASGLIAALKASEKSDVIILEKNDKLGKKLLLTGNGKCNYWHDNISKDNYYTDDEIFLEKVLSHKDRVFSFLTSLGIYPKNKNGYYYPYSESASSFEKILENNIKKKSNIKVICNYEVSVIKKEDNKFIINDDITCDNLIIASGSKAYPKTGSTGFSYEYAKKVGLNVNPVLPSLVSLKSNESFLKDLSGIRCEANLSLFINDKFIKNEKGEVQFTDYGISGICTFNLSSLVSKSIYEKNNVLIKISFFPDIPDIYSFISKRCDMLKSQSVQEILESLLNYKLISVILKRCHIKNDMMYSDLNEMQKKELCKMLSSFEISINDVNTFDKSQSCTGGISLNEISDNLETKKISHLFFVGECLDVDGICGGYNLAFAFITGYLSGESIYD